jgi:hypothetical protein
MDMRSTLVARSAHKTPARTRGGARLHFSVFGRHLPVSLIWRSVVTVLLVGATACASRTEARLPRSTTPPITAPTPSPTSAEDAARQAYLDFWPALGAAAKLPPEQARQRLKAHATGKYLDRQINVIRRMRGKREPWGQPVVRVTDIKVAGKRATIQDCQDGTAAGQADSRTHQLIPGTKGDSNVPVEATLVRSADGRWLVMSVYYEESRTCNRPTS